VSYSFRQAGQWRQYWTTLQVRRQTACCCYCHIDQAKLGHPVLLIACWWVLLQRAVWVQGTEAGMRADLIRSACFSTKGPQSTVYRQLPLWCA
jgi:hypothetical protein